MTDQTRQSECQRHRNVPIIVDGRRTLPYLWTRCSHIGNRFVVECRSQDSGFVTVDYVEDLDGPHADVLVEANTFSLGAFPPGHWAHQTEADVQRTWEQLIEKMRRGEPPTKET